MIGKVKVVMLKGEKGDTGATGDYSGILNKPQINSVELDGNKSASDLGLATASEQQNILDTLASHAEFIAALYGKQPFVITADYDSTNKTFSNVSSTSEQAYLAVQASRPCLLVGVETNGALTAYYVFYCFNAFKLGSNYVAKFISLDTGHLGDTLQLLGTTVTYGTAANNTPFIVTADYVSSTRTLSNLNSTAEQIYNAVIAERPVLIFASEDSVTRHIMSSIYAVNDNGTYKTVFSVSADGNEDTFVVSGSGNTTNVTYRNDFTQGVFAAASGVSATETFYRKGVVYALNLSAAGVFTAGITTIGTYSGMDIPTNGVGGICLLLTGYVNNVPTYIPGYFTLAANGDLIIVSNQTFYSVKVNLTYILP